jgi:hypothetical protein
LVCYQDDLALSTTQTARRRKRIGPRAVGQLESEVDDAIAAFTVAEHDKRE